MRLFVALLPPPRVLDEVEAAFAPHRDGHPGLRWTGRVTWHVTLAFYGEVEGRVADRLLPRLERAAARHPARDLAFTGAGTFPRRTSAARVLWTGIDADLRRLADSCLAAGRREGLDTSTHQHYYPHLTVGRARTPIDLTTLVAHLSAFEGTPWPADEIHLVQSHLGADVRYETLHSWPLGRS